MNLNKQKSQMNNSNYERIINCPLHFFMEEHNMSFFTQELMKCTEGFDGRKCIGVITSYSIHYTKLYDEFLFLIPTNSYLKRFVMGKS